MKIVFTYLVKPVVSEPFTSLSTKIVPPVSLFGLPGINMASIVLGCRRPMHLLCWGALSV